MRVDEALATATQYLQLSSDSPRLDAEALLAHALQISRSMLFAYPERALTKVEQDIFLTLTERRLVGEPIAYLLGSKEFWSLTLGVNSQTLIPRPETELLVELALSKLPEQDKLMIADLGTGSGAIALSIAKERPKWFVCATDINSETLAVAHKNAANLEIKNIIFKIGSWCNALSDSQKWDAILSNPPYIAEDDSNLELLSYEPKRALVAGPTGLESTTEIILQAPKYLKSGGWLFLEHGFDQSSKVQHLLSQVGFEQVTSHLDLAGLPRVTLAQWLKT
jgi:release factor glutamine methyltransferase